MRVKVALRMLILLFLLGFVGGWGWGGGKLPCVFINKLIYTK